MSLPPQPPNNAPRNPQDTHLQDTHTQNPHAQATDPQDGRPPAAADGPVLDSTSAAHVPNPTIAPTPGPATFGPAATEPAPQRPPQQRPVLQRESAVPAAEGSPGAPAAETPAAPPRSYVAGVATAGLAAVCGAIFTSWLGAQGTLAGAMIGATIGSSVSEIVRAPLASLERRIIQAGVSVHQVRRDGLFKTIVSSPVAAQQVFGLVSRRAIITVAVVALVGFAVAMGGVTAVEVARGEPLAAIVTDEPATGTTLGHVIPNPPPVLAPAEDEDKTTATPGPTGDATPGATGTPPAGTGTPVGTGTPATTLTPPARTATAATAATAGISTATPARPTATSAARPTTSGSTPAPPAASPRPAP